MLRSELDAVRFAAKADNHARAGDPATAQVYATLALAAATEDQADYLDDVAEAIKGLGIIADAGS